MANQQAFLVTTQEPGAIRYRCIVQANSTFDAVEAVLTENLDPNTYVSAKPASADDLFQYRQYLGYKAPV